MRRSPHCAPHTREREHTWTRRTLTTPSEVTQVSVLPLCLQQALASLHERSAGSGAPPACWRRSSSTTAAWQQQHQHQLQQQERHSPRRSARSCARSSSGWRCSWRSRPWPSGAWAWSCSWVRAGRSCAARATIWHRDGCAHSARDSESLCGGRGARKRQRIDHDAATHPFLLHFCFNTLCRRGRPALAVADRGGAGVQEAHRAEPVLQRLLFQRRHRR